MRDYESLLTFIIYNIHEQELWVRLKITSSLEQPHNDGTLNQAS